MAILQSYYQDVYRSPVVRLSGYSGRHELASSILAYLDFGGATGTCKDGVAETMLAFATERGTLQPGMPVVEASSGSFGAALAVSCATTGHPCILVVPSSLPLSRVMQALGTPEAGNAREMNDFYENELANHADLMPGALTALEELGEVATLAIVSNGATQVQESRIAASGIGRFMDGVYISEKVGAAKPSPKLLDYAIRDLGLTNRSRVLMVGDDLLADIKGGINAGIDTCWVNFANEENKTGIQPKYTVHSYEELYRIVMEPEELENVGVRNRRHMNEG